MYESSSQQCEGFYKQQVIISDLQEQDDEKAQTVQINIANQIIDNQRPKDGLPRFIVHRQPIYQYIYQQQLMHRKYDSNIDNAPSVSSEQIGYFVNKKSLKKQKYTSLKHKYTTNSDYSLVYAKYQTHDTFNNHIFSLQFTTDYNQNQYQTVRQNISTNFQSNSAFDSSFQCGNLSYAYQYLPSRQILQYDLILQNDTNTYGFNQWFYFSFNCKVCNCSKNKVHFNIVNFIKKHLMFEQGIRPVAFSKKKNEWSFIGENISYYKNYINKSSDQDTKSFYTLSFDYIFQQNQDIVYFALNFPYTYSKMTKYLSALIQIKPSTIIINKHILCYTLSNNPVYWLSIKHYKNNNDKKILILCRQHPGQTVSSFVLQGFLSSIVLQKQFLKQYQLIVIPMVNPDGVIYGNFRTNLAGFDLNRTWINPKKLLHPQIYYLKKFIKSLDKIEFVLDFHGHSKKYNSFIYGCNGQNINQFRLFPYIFSKKCQLFNIKSCTFNITPDKYKTARVNLFNQTKLPYIYTLQTSFFAYQQKNKKYRLTFMKLIEIGTKAAQSLNIFFTDKRQMKQVNLQIKDKSYLFQIWSMQNQGQNGSDSNPSEDQLSPMDLKLKVINVKKQKKKKKQKLVKQINLKPIRKIYLQKKIQNTIPTKINFKSTKKSFQKQKKIKQIQLQKSQIKLNSNIFNLVNDIEQQQIKNKKISDIQNNIVKDNIINSSNLLNTSNYFQMKRRHFNKKNYQISKTSTNSPLQITENYKNHNQIYFKQSNFAENNCQKYLTKKILNKKQSHSLLSSPHSTTFQNNNKYSSISKYSNSNNNNHRNPKQHTSKVYIIKNNHVINSKIQNQLNSKLQAQLNNRTQKLRNCQQRMNQTCLDVSSIRSVTNEEFAISYSKRLYSMCIKNLQNVSKFNLH